MDWSETHGGGGWAWMWIVGFAFLILLVALAVVLIVRLTSPQPLPPNARVAPARRSAEDVLAERFARGEIDAKEYRERRRTLRSN
jgi:putative membrane protein